MRSLLMALTSILAFIASYAMSPEAGKSYEEFEARALAGDSALLFRLSSILERGYDTIQADTARSLALLKRSAKAGYPPAQNYLGYLYREGRMLKADKDSAFYWIRKAADAGDPKALHNMAWLLLQSDHETDSVAVEYLRKGVSAGIAPSMTVLADMYAQGRGGLPKDSLEAQNLYEKAISNGFGDAELKLLNMMGPKWRELDSENSLQLARRYWKMGAPIIAVELLQQIAPDGPRTAEAYAMLGYAYSMGHGVGYNHAKSMEYFSESARLGDPGAQFILAETMEIFPDWDKDNSQTLSLTPDELRTEAAKKGIHTAEEARQHILGTE